MVEFTGPTSNFKNPFYFYSVALRTVSMNLSPAKENRADKVALLLQADTIVITAIQLLAPPQNL